MDRKTVWIIGAAGPIEGENWRDYRDNQFGKYLSQHGYNVVWWTSNFAHHFKKHRSDGWKDISVTDHFTIRLVPSTGYRKNFGVGRILSLIIFSYRAGKQMEKEPIADVVLGSSVLTKGYPVFTYAKKHGAKSIVDQGDIWPEFIELGFGRFSKVVHFFFKPLYRAREKNYSEASALIALGKNYLEFAQNVAPNGHEKPCALVYNGIDVDQFNEMAKIGIPPELAKKVNKQQGETLCIFAGTFGPSYDIAAMLDCAKKFDDAGEPVKFVFAGSGPRVTEVEEMAKKHSNIVFVGALKPSELIPLYTVCDIGLCPYTAMSNVDMPDKFYDYTAAGLAVVNSLTEEVAERIVESNVGFNYIASDSKDLFMKIQQLVSDKDLMMKMKNNSKILGLEFDAKVQNKKLADLIDVLLNTQSETQMGGGY